MQNGGVLGSLKSIQRGVFSLSGASGNQTVAAVNMAKSKLNFLGVSYNGTSLNEVSVYMSLTNASNILFSRSGSAAGAFISWELIEYN